MGAMKVKLIENTKYNNDNILFKNIIQINLKYLLENIYEK